MSEDFFARMLSLSEGELTEPPQDPWDVFQQYVETIRAGAPVISATEGEALLRRLWSGDTAARRRLVESFLELPMVLAAHTTRPTENVLDVTEDLNGALVRTIDSYRDSGEVTQYRRLVGKVVRALLDNRAV